MDCGVCRDVSGVSVMYKCGDSICFLARKCLFAETLHREWQKQLPAAACAGDLVAKEKSRGLLPVKMTFLGFCQGHPGGRGKHTRHWHWPGSRTEKLLLPLPLCLPQNPPSPGLWGDRAGSSTHPKKPVPTHAHHVLEQLQG